MADGSGGKSDPPVGTGRGLKLCASKAAERGRPVYPGGLVSFYPSIACINFGSCNLLEASHLVLRRPQGSKTNMLTAAFCGVGDEPNCLKENLNDPF